MQNELLIKRLNLKTDMCVCMARFMRETDKEEARKILADMHKIADEIEKINCELVAIEIRKKLKWKEES